MDDQSLGTTIRSLRIRRGLRQSDLAGMAGISQPTISRLERGHLATLSLNTMRRVAGVLDVRIDVVPRWRGGDLDRMLNARHSRLHELVARRFTQLPGWTASPEVSFAIRGERGVMDLLAFHRQRDMLLVIELKTEIVDINELLGTLDRKRRLALSVGEAQGLPVGASTTVSTWLIVAEGRTNRRRVGAHRAVLRSAFPTDGRTITGWLTRPNAPIRVLSFWPDSHPGNARSGLAGVRRVRKHASCSRRGASAAPQSRERAYKSLGD